MFISLSSLFASLAFRFAVFSSTHPLPALSPCLAMEGRALLLGSQRRRVERGGMEEGFVRVHWGERGFGPEPVGGPVEPVAELGGPAPA